jgi:putative nucleotidyltransferase with HDIG domain
VKLGVAVSAFSFLQNMSIQKGMSSVISAPRAPCEKLSLTRVYARLGGCAALPSLSTIDSALRELLDADRRYNSQIADIIRRDPSLTTRLLKLVNAVHYGTAKPARNIDEAVFYLGVRQVRQLAMVTQIIEDFQKLVQGHCFPWRQFWQHCIATALMTREITNMLQSQEDETDYIGGLIHDVGKIVMASAFPDHFDEIYRRRAQEGGDLRQLEREVLGVDHADLGAMYLRKHGLADAFIEIVQFHHAPQLAHYQTSVTAAVHVSDLLVRHRKIGDSGNHAEVPCDSWLESPGWKILVGHQTEAERDFLRASLNESLERLPTVLESLV